LTSPNPKPTVSAPANGALLRQARSAQQEGDRGGALRLLRRAASEDPGNENIWLLAATLAQDSSEAAAYVERALRINPSNDRARNWIKSYRAKKARLSAKPAPKPTPEVRAEAPDPKPRPAPRLVAVPPMSPRLVPRSSAATAPSTTEDLRQEPPPTPVAHPQPAVSATPITVRADVAREPAPEVARLAWHCPLCRAGAEERRSHCNECGAFTDLDNVDGIARNDGVNEELVSAAGSRLEEALEQGPDFDVHVALALVYLNLKRSPAAMEHLAAAAALCPDETRIKDALRTLRARKLVLVADEISEFREWLRCLLESYRVRVQTSSDGMKALGGIEQETPDLIFASGTLPGLNGYGLCKSLHKNPYTNGIPVVITTQKRSMVDKAHGKTVGARETVARSFDPGNAIRTVKKHVPSSYLPDPELEFKNMFKM